MPGTRRASVAVMFAAGFALLPFGATAQPVDLNIPAQPLARALQQFIEQTHAQLMFAPETVGAATTPGLRGHFETPRDALNALVRDSGLTVRQTADNAFVLVRAEGADAARPRTYALDEVVVTATKTPVAVADLPVSVTVIPKEEIQQSTPRDLSDMLRRVPGVDVSRNSSAGVATISMRGMGFQRTAVLIDGQPADFLPTGVGGVTAVQAVDPENVERIEVVRGAGSALYGSNAMGGVVNIITKKGVAGKPESEIHAGWDSLDTWITGASSRGGVGRVTYNLTANYLDSGGYKPLTAPRFDTEDYNLQDVTWRNRRLGGTLGINLAQGHDLTLTANDYLDDNNTFGRPNTTAEIHTTVVGVESANKLSDVFKLTSSLSYRTQQGDYDFDSFMFFMNPDTSKTSTLDESADKLVAEVKGQWDANQQNRVLIGASYALDTVSLIYNDPTTGTRTDDRNGDVHNYAAYLQDEISLTDRWNLTLGGRYDRFDYDLSYTNFTTAPVTSRSVNKSWDTFNPRAATRYDITEEVGVRASAGTGFRAPDTFGLMGRQLVPGVLDFRPNPNLRDERSHNYDVGTDLAFPFGLTTSLTGFYSEIKDAIAVRRFGAAPLVLQFANVGDVVSQGLELDVRQRFWTYWQVGLGYTYTDSRITSAAVDAVTWPAKGSHSNLTPMHKVVASLGYDQPDFLAVRLDGRYAGDQFMQGDLANAYANRLAPYFTADLSATYTLPIRETRVLVTGAITNMLDRQYATTSVGYFEEPRVFHMRLGVKF